MPKEGERAWRIAELGDDELGKSRLDEETTPASGLFNGAGQVLFTERAEQNLARLQMMGEVGKGAELSVEVGPDGHHAPARVGVDAVDECGAIVRTATEREEFLELVDDEHSIGMRRQVGGVERVERLHARGG